MSFRGPRSGRNEHERFLASKGLTGAKTPDQLKIEELKSDVAGLLGRLQQQTSIHQKECDALREELSRVSKTHNTEFASQSRVIAILKDEHQRQLKDQHERIHLEIKDDIKFRRGELFKVAQAQASRHILEQCVQRQGKEFDEIAEIVKADLKAGQ